MRSFTCSLTLAVHAPVEELNTVPFYTSLMKLLEGGRTGESENGILVANVWCMDLNYTKSIAALYPITADSRYVFVA